MEEWGGGLVWGAQGGEREGREWWKKPQRRSSDSLTGEATVWVDCDIQVRRVIETGNVIRRQERWSKFLGGQRQRRPFVT